MKPISARIATALVSLGVLVAATAARAEPASPWRGLYVGAHGGFDNVSWSLTSGLGSTIKEQGAVFGGHAGYNWQSKGFVVGVEADLSSSSASRERTRGTTTTKLSTPYLASVRARAGFTLGPALLAYATGGLAFASVDINASDTSYGFNLTASGPSTGWVFGGGLEYMMPNTSLSVRGEILHYAFSATDIQYASYSVFNVDTSATVVRAGIGYHFN